MSTESGALGPTCATSVDSLWSPKRGPVLLQPGFLVQAGLKPHTLGVEE